MIATIKGLTLLGWLIIIANWLAPFSEPAHTVLHWTGLVLLAAHILEALIYLPLIKRVGGATTAHIIQVMIFGYGHFLALKRQQAATGR